ncbi:MAG: sporulation integral membrane protein YlbJ [Bacillota bacterium]|jgi:sporulation integral membrane protein YlbJ|nr:sporulation integral membrane protein YlbJ [Candidatus Fermentithermobacillaceae bacterium]
MDYFAIILAVVFIAYVSLWRPRKDALLSAFLALLVVILAASMILFPEPSFKAAERGLTVWWNIVLPALLPFFIAAELLMGMGVVHLVGVLMEPLMRPLFNVPGAGAFVLAMGIASGYPLGAALSARLKDDKLATKTEAERLMCFCNTSDPLFMTGAVAVGMFRRADLAGVIIAAHYLSGLTIGICMRFWRREEHRKQLKAETQMHKQLDPPLTRAFRAMRQAQREANKSLGELLGESVKRSVDTLLIVLGFMVLFSVIFEILTLAGATDYISRMISKAVPESLLPRSLHQSVVSGLFEITIGTSLASQADAPLIARVAVCSGIIAWSGLSVHAQVAAVIQPSGLSIRPYSITRFGQAVLAAIYTVLIMRIDGPRWALPAFQPVLAETSWFHSLGASTKACICWILLMGAAALVLAAGDRLKRAWNNRR